MELIINNLLAQEGITNPALKPELQTELSSGEGVEFFADLLPRLVGILMVGGVIAFVFYMLIGAIEWIGSGGDKAKVESARGKLTNAIMGLILLLAVFAIIGILEQFFKINILTLDIGVLTIE